MTNKEAVPTSVYDLIVKEIVTHVVEPMRNHGEPDVGHAARDICERICQFGIKEMGRMANPPNTSEVVSQPTVGFGLFLTDPSNPKSDVEVIVETRFIYPQHIAKINLLAITNPGKFDDCPPCKTNDHRFVDCPRRKGGLDWGIPDEGP